MNIRRYPLVCGVLAAALALGGCSSDDSTPSSSSGSDAPSESGDTPAEATETSASIIVTGEALPAGSFQGEEQTPPSGLAPTIGGVGFDGSPVTITPGANGKPMAVIFVAHWCPHCQKEVPLLAQLLKTNTSISGVEVAFVSTSVRPEADNYPPSEWLKPEWISTPVLADDAKSTAAAAYGVGGYPFLVFLDSEGKVTGRFSGEMGLEDLAARFKKAAGA